MSKKPNIFDNSNLQSKEQWGNIELPGLTDEKLHSKDWHKSFTTSQANKLRYAKKYIVRSPGNDLLDYYDQEMLKLHPASKAFSKIPPSKVFEIRFRTEYPIFKRGANRPGKWAYIRNLLLNYYDTDDNTYYAQIYKTRFSWLVDQPHEQWEFEYANQAYNFLITKTNQSSIRKIISTNREDTDIVKSQMFWRGSAKGWSVIVDD